MKYFFIFLCLLYSFATIGSELSLKEALKILKKGGNVLYFRHTSTNHLEKDTNFSSCKGQRNLSEQGIEEAKKIGKAFVAYKILIGEVLSSPVCRCKDTARLAFKKFKIVKELKPSTFFDSEESKKLALFLKEELKKKPEQGKNNIIIGHSGNLKEAIKIWPKPEGVIYIFKPDQQSFKTLGFINPRTW